MVRQGHELVAAAGDLQIPAAMQAVEIKVEGDLAKLVAMQTVEPGEPQKRLTRQIAAITS